MQNLKYNAAAIVLLHDENHGVVSWDGDKKNIEYSLHQKNRPGAFKSMQTLAKIFFKAGAEEVYLPTLRRQVCGSLTKVNQLVNEWQEEDDLPFGFTAYHPQGTCRMGTDAKNSVVNQYGETHDVKNLFVADASIIPTSILVNPQVTIYALAHYISDQINGPNTRSQTKAKPVKS